MTEVPDNVDWGWISLGIIALRKDMRDIDPLLLPHP
jgi:hypothetical protein